jgi:hypothetical protein
MSAARLLAATLLGASLSAQIYDNGPIVTDPVGAPGAAPLSLLQAGSPLQMDALGISAQSAVNDSVADDFAVCGVAQITDIEVFGYLTNATAPSATGVFLEIYNGDPSAGGVPVPGSPGFANNLFHRPGYVVSNTMTNVFRSVLPANTLRNVQSIRVTLTTPLVLTGGVYWLRYAYTGVSFTPPITVLGQAITGNAKQNQAGVWVPFVDYGNPVVPVPYPCGVPFKIYGNPISAGSITDTGLASCGATTITVRGAPVLGGFVRTELGNVTGLGLIGYGFAHTGTPFCGCVVGHEWSSVQVATSNVLNIPMNRTFCGTVLRVQGAVFGGAGGCPSPAVTFTSTFQIALN